MTRRSIVVAASIAAGWLLTMPAHGFAQSSIGGTVKDTSGAVLPGVTVTVTSPALLEGSKEATSDGSGNYRVSDLRPGMYSVKFVLTGFTTVERQAFQLLTDFNARIDAEMKVGAMEETITVSGQAPIVDVQTAAHVAVLDRNALDNVPTGKTIPGLGQLIIGVSLSAPDIGGSAGAMNTYMSLRGGTVNSSQNTVMVDGMMINGLQGDGSVQTYTNDTDFQEMSYQTAGMGAERSGGGVAVNLIPKEGGNWFSGSSSALYRPGQLQAMNYSDRFKEWGLPKDKNGDPAVNRIDKIYDLNIAEGGPIRKDSLWFFVSGRSFVPNNTVPNTFLDDGSQGIDDNHIRNTLVRLTYQMSSKHKVGAYFERVFKWRGHDMSSADDPETAAIVWTSPNYHTASAKYTGTFSSRLLVEGGFSQNIEFYRTNFQPGIAKERGTPEWYANASRTNTSAGTITAPAQSAMRYPVSKVWVASASYVTGAHHTKVGLSLRHGPFHNGTDNNADLQQSYPIGARDSNYNTVMPTTVLYDTNPALFAELFPSLKTTGAPCNTVTSTTTCSVTIRNNPRLYTNTLNQDLGLYAQDSFTMKRLTINAGIRWEKLTSEVTAGTSPGGRFINERVVTQVNKVPDWTDWAPRFQLVYDVFGNSKTAVKYSFNRYNDATTTSVADLFNPITIVTSSRNWIDLNRDDIAQGQRTFNADGTFSDCVYLTPGCEIYLSGPGSSQTPLSPTFGGLADVGQFNGYERPYRLEQGLEVQHALLPRLSLNGAYYHGWNRNLTKTVNLARTDDGTKGTEYRAMTLFNPLDGTPFTYYNEIVTLPTDNYTFNEPLRETKYDSYTAEMQMRPYAGAQLSGGIEMTRVINKNCGTSFLRRDGSPAAVNPNTLRFCDEEHMVAYEGGPTIDKPFTKNFKLNGSFPVVYGINIGLSYQNIDSGNIAPTFRYGTGASFVYPDGTTKKMLGNSAVVPACPTTYGCVPGGPSVPANFVGGAAGTVIGSAATALLVAPGTISEERIVQLDLKASKNFRFGRISVQPALEMFNLLNIDQVRSRISQEIGNAAGSYLQPNNMLQGRIIGFGANVKW